jgi:hypothetical protein
LNEKEAKPKAFLHATIFLKIAPNLKESDQESHPYAAWVFSIKLSKIGSCIARS